jgi:hypothetical protein
VAKVITVVKKILGEERTCMHCASLPVVQGGIRNKKAGEGVHTIIVIMEHCYLWWCGWGVSNKIKKGRGECTVIIITHHYLMLGED